MPRFADAYLTGSLPRSHDPLDRISSQPPKIGLLDPAELLEMWTQWVLDYGLDAFAEATGFDLRLLQAAFDGLDLLNPQAVLTGFRTFLDDLITPGAIEEGGLPYTLPFTLSSPSIRWFRNLRQFLPADFSAGGFVLDDVLDQFINDRLIPRDILAQAQTIVDAFANINPVVGGLGEQVWNSINGLLGIGNTAQGSANLANSEVAVIKSTLESMASGGISGSDTFDRALASTLGSSYSQVGFGGGGGTYGTNGLGQASWDASGSSERSFVNIRNDVAFTTKYQVCTLLLTEKVKSGGNRSVWMVPRCDSAGNNFVYARVHDDIVEVGAYYSGAFHWWDEVEYDNADGERWDFWAGTSASDRQYVVKRNNVTILTVNEPGTSSGIDPATYNRPAFAVTAGASAFFAPQSVPPDIDVFTWADRDI
jgi:hypothetical protein